MGRQRGRLEDDVTSITNGYCSSVVTRFFEDRRDATCAALTVVQVNAAIWKHFEHKSMSLFEVDNFKE